MGETKKSRAISLHFLTALVFTYTAMGLSAKEKAGPEQLLLKDFHPESVYKVPQTTVPKAKYPAIDMHAHVYAKTPEQVAKTKGSYTGRFLKEVLKK